jgi:hypothetical protein
MPPEADMPQRDKTICLLFGVVELTCAALWCVGGAGVYGSPLVGLDDAQRTRVWLFLAVGPFSVLPAALTMLWHRRLGAAWLVGGGVVSGGMAVTWFLADRGVLLAPLVWAPMIGVGLWQLLSPAGPASTDTRTGARAGSLALGVTLFVAGWVGTYALLLALALNNVTGLRGGPVPDAFTVENQDLADSLTLLVVGAAVALVTLLRGRLKLRWEFLAGQWVAVLLAGLVIRAR